MFLLRRPSSVFFFFGIRHSASSASAAAARGARCRGTPRRAAQRRRRVGLRHTAASAYAHARCFWFLARAAGIWLLRHLRRPRAARGAESRRVGLRDGRDESGCAARPRRRTRTRDNFCSCCHCFWLLARAAGFWLLRHLRRPRAARGVESRRVGLRDGRGASGCAARPRRRTRTRDNFGSCCHCAIIVCGRA